MASFLCVRNLFNREDVVVILALVIIVGFVSLVDFLALLMLVLQGTLAVVVIILAAVSGLSRARADWGSLHVI